MAGHNIFKMQISTIFSQAYLNESINLTTKNAIIALVVLALFVVCGIALQLFIDKKKAPHFYKRLIKWIGDFLLYIPLIIVFLLAVYLAGFQVKKLFFLIILAIWLIWFLFLVYYRIAKVSALWYKYREFKRKEKYQNNGK